MAIKKAETLDDVIKFVTVDEFGFDAGDAVHCGSIKTLLRVDKENDLGYQSLNWLMENFLPPLKVIKWGELTKLRKDKKIVSWGGLGGNSAVYQALLPYCYAGPSNGSNRGDCTFMTGDFNFTSFERILPDAINQKYDCISNSNQMLASSSHYHSAKAHWLVDSIRKEGLWAPIQGQVKSHGDDGYKISIHPGSIRSCVFEEMDDPDMELLVWDHGGIPAGRVIDAEEALNIFKEALIKQGSNLTMSIIVQGGVVEFACAIADIKFREQVSVFNKKIHEAMSGKPLTIYVGYDSRHQELPNLCKKTMEQFIENNCRGDFWSKLITDLQPKVKYLDISKIPEYTREYANQSTEFTYSRFLIPYLENYEGFSMFVDDDFIFKKSPLPMFYYVDPDNAVTCVQYGDFDAEDTKFDGEKNVSYPKKLWSSLMFFNNGHEDCKKLTPEVVNTASGKYLHQFEWTDKIGSIPEKYIFTEGYDDPVEKWDYTAVHFTRGGPWIEGMETDHIDLLDEYYRAKGKYGL